MMNPRGERRMERFERDGTQKPLMRCLRKAIAVAYYAFGFESERWTLNELRALDKSLEIVYDRATAVGDGPGHHVYRRIHNGGVRADDTLQLEISLQHDMDLPWPQGKPRAPGPWVIAELKSRWKRNMSGDEDHIEKALEAGRDAGNDAKEAQSDKEMREAHKQIHEEIIAPYFEKGREPPMGYRQKARHPKGEKTQVRMTEKAR